MRPSMPGTLNVSRATLSVTTTGAIWPTLAGCQGHLAAADARARDSPRDRSIDGAPRQPAPRRARGARPVANATCRGGRREPADDQLDRDRPVLPVGPARVPPRRRAPDPHRRAVPARRRPARSTTCSTATNANRPSTSPPIGWPRSCCHSGSSSSSRGTPSSIPQSSWDLLGLLILSGVIGTGYRLGKGATTTRLFSVMALAAIVAVLVAIGLAVFLQPR